jgi:hypothetical protein
MVGERGFEPPTPWSRIRDSGVVLNVFNLLQWCFDRLILPRSCHSGANVSPRMAVPPGPAAKLFVLAVAVPVRHRMDGAKPFHRCAYRALWSRVVDGRDRLPRASAGDHSRPRARFNSQKGSRARLEGKAITSAVCRGDPCNVTCNLDRSGDLSVGCTDLADSGPAYRKTSCHLNG